LKVPHTPSPCMACVWFGRRISKENWRSLVFTISPSTFLYSEDLKGELKLNTGTASRGSQVV